MLQGILLAVIVILLLVVLVPVGIALFQRLRPERSAPRRRARSRRRLRAIRRPTAKIASAPAATSPTDKVSAPTSRSTPPRPPADLTPRRIEPSRTSRHRTARASPTLRRRSAGTEMMQWYGMLHCTGGPLEGQRFIIEDDGFYIGRDPVAVQGRRPRHARLEAPRAHRAARRKGLGHRPELDQRHVPRATRRITEVQLKRGDTLVLGDNAATFVYQI